MRVRLLEDVAGEGSQGDTLNIPSRHAMELLRREVAEAVDLETASIVPPSCEGQSSERERRPKRKQRKR